MLGQNSREAAHIPARSAEARSAGPRLFSGVLCAAPAGKWALSAGKTGYAAPFSLLPQGLRSAEDAAPTFLLSCQKKSRRRSGGKEKRLCPNLRWSASLGNTVLNCSAQKPVCPCVARAGCGGCPARYAVTMKPQTSGCGKDTLSFSFRAPRVAQRCPFRE